MAIELRCIRRGWYLRPGWSLRCDAFCVCVHCDPVSPYLDLVMGVSTARNE